MSVAATRWAEIPGPGLDGGTRKHLWDVYQSRVNNRQTSSLLQQGGRPWGKKCNPTLVLTTTIY